jgi:hypothetical protein
MIATADLRPEVPPAAPSVEIISAVIVIVIVIVIYLTFNRA